MKRTVYISGRTAFHLYTLNNPLITRIARYAVAEKSSFFVIMYEPDLYTTVNDLHRRDARDFAEEFVNEIGKVSGRCLDVGSGPGDTVVDFILPKLNPEVNLVCSDISKKMVNFGKEKYKDHSRLSFLELDIETPELSQDLIEQFDHVTSFYCLHWCQDLRQVFENIFNLLTPGGTTLFTLVCNCPGLNAYTKLAALPRYQSYMKDAGHYIPVFHNIKQPRDTLIALLKDTGFEIQHCSLREKTYIFNTRDELDKFMLAVNPFAHRMPTDLRKEFSKDLATEVAKESIVFNKNNNGDDYSVLFMFSTFIVYLKKPSIN